MTEFIESLPSVNTADKMVFWSCVIGFVVLLIV